MHDTYWQTLWFNLTHFGAPNTPVSLLEKIVRPVVVYLTLVWVLRKFGRRVLAQLNPFDFVVLLTLSNTVQNAIIGNDTSLTGGLVGAAALIGINWLLVRHYYRGASGEHVVQEQHDVALINHGKLVEPEMHRFRINAGELTAKAHERGFDSLSEVEDAFLYPNGTIYFRGHHPDIEDRRHRELVERIEHLQRQIAALRR